MKIYLAGPSAELDLVRAAATVIEAAGHTITEPWWLRIEEAARRGWTTDADVPTDFMAESARRNMAGMLAADYVVALCRTQGGLCSTHAPVAIVGNPRNHVAAFDEWIRVVATVEQALRAFDEIEEALPR